jgi:hypothetical protein
LEHLLDKRELRVTSTGLVSNRSVVRQLMTEIGESPLDVPTVGIARRGVAEKIHSRIGAPWEPP